MKEVRFFYTPEPQTGKLPDDEAAHAVRVLRMTEGDELFLHCGNNAAATSMESASSFGDGRNKEHGPHRMVCREGNRDWV